MLEADIKQQLDQYLQLMEGDVVLRVSAGDDAVSKEMLDLVNELASMSSRISVENVTYTVPGVDRPILSNISFEIAAGETPARRAGRKADPCTPPRNRRRAVSTMAIPRR